MASLSDWIFPNNITLKGLFKKDGIIYEIDYTNCKNENIKKKMMELT